MTRKDTRTPDQLFAAFRGDDDIDALATLFDRIAPTLLRIADRLARDRSSAEDLLQSTFLAAIANREQFDSSRALTPWLVGILVNRARQVWRQSHAHEHEPLPDEVVGPRETPSPGELLELDEFQEALLGAISELPSSVRSAVAGRLLDEESHAQLASKLGISRENLRVRLHRGLAMLRTRLRPSYGPLAFFPPLAGLNMRLRLRPLRRQILDSTHKRLGSGMGSAGAAAGVLAGGGALLLGAASVLGAAGLALVLHSSEPAPLEPQPTTPEALSGTAESADSRSEPPATASAREPERAALMPPESENSEAAPPMGMLQIQVLRDADRTAVASARLCLRSELLDNSIKPTVYTTDDAGLASIPFEAGVLKDAVTLLPTSTTIPALARLHGKLRADEVKSITIQASDGEPLKVRVLDRDLLPVSDATVELTFRNKSLDGIDRVALTGSSGYATLQHVGRPIVIRAHKSGMVSINELHGRMKSERREWPESLILAPETVQSGLVVDAQGQPVGGAQINMQLDNEVRSMNVKRGSVLRSEPITWELTTEADGTFLVPRVPRAPLTIQIHKQGLRTWSSRIESPGGELAVTLQSYPRFPGTVTDKDSGPISDALVQLVVQESGNSQVVGETRTNRKGKFDLEVSEDLPLRQLGTFVRVEHEDFITSAWRILDPEHREDKPLNLTLVHGVSVTGQVTEEDGTPVAGALISLDADCEANWRMVPPQDQAGDLLAEVAHAQADAEGHFELTGSPSVPHLMRIHRPGKLRASLVVQLSAGTTETNITLPPFLAEEASIRGELIDAQTGKPVPDGRVTVEYLFGSGTNRPASYPFPASALNAGGTKGAFQFPDLQAGLVHISASAPGYETPHFLPLDLKAGQRELQIRLMPLRAITLDLTLPDELSPEMLKLAITRQAGDTVGRLPRKPRAYRAPKWTGWTLDKATGSYRIYISRVPACPVTLTIESDHRLLEKRIDLGTMSSKPLQITIEG